MAEIVILGAGLSGALMAYEMRAELRPEDRLTVVNKGGVYHFVPSNPWLAIGWRSRKDVEVALEEVMQRKDIRLLTCGAARVHPHENRVDLLDGSSVDYDYLIIATGPELAFDEISGFGPQGHTQSICQIDHAEQAYDAFERLCAAPGPVIIGAAQGASCFGPAYEFAMAMDTELRRRRLRDKIPMTFVTPEPYIGHLGLDGVGDTKGMLEHEMRQRHIKWLTNCRIAEVRDGAMTAEELGADGVVARSHELPFVFSMMLPAFRGIAAVRGVEHLVNPRGFILADEFQRNPTFRNVFSVGVCVAIPPIGPTPVPCGVPKTGFMIESMVTATAKNVGALLRNGQVGWKPTLNAVCLADFGDGGVAFVAQPQIPPRNVNWSSDGRWVHLAKIAYEKYFLGKIRYGKSEPFFERLILDSLGIRKIHPVPEKLQGARP